jgi:PAS domain S-box-containing protein
MMESKEYTLYGETSFPVTTYGTLNMIVQHTRTMLVATDDPETCDHFHRLFEPGQYVVLDCNDADALFDMVREGTPDIVLIDDSLSSYYTGSDLCLKLKKLAEMEDTPIIMILARDDESLIAQALIAGATDYVTKPLRSAVVRQRVRYLLQMTEMQEHLREKEERYRIVSTTISDYAYAYGVNPDGSLVKEWSTKAFETITGYAHSELDGNGWSQLIHPADDEVTRRRYQRLINGEKDVSEFRIVTKTGEVRWLLDHAQPVFDERTGRIVRIYGAAQDITERKRTEELLLAQTEELQERNQELDSFAHTVAHDLKNPISSMMGFASLVLNYYDRMTDDKIQEYLSLIMESGYKLKEIINSLLLLASVSKLDRVNLEPLDMSNIINESKRRMVSMIDEHKAEIIAPDQFPIALGYAPWVEEVWANYLSNALKYGGNPPRVQLGADGPVDGMVRFWVVDNGSGIPPEQRDKVFLPFTRFSQAKIEGHGLGLSVVHTIVQKLGGFVGIEDADTGGCKFTFTLPAA